MPYLSLLRIEDTTNADERVEDIRREDIGDKLSICRI
jgi:hypothetical protein